MIRHCLLLAFTATQVFKDCSSSPITSLRTKPSVISPLSSIDGINVLQASSGKESDLSKISITYGKKCLLVFLTHLGDLSSWELAQKLAYYMPQIENASIDLVAVAPGGEISHAHEFCFKTGMPIDKLYLDLKATSYDALKFDKGFMPEANISPYLKLLPMLMGIQSEGTIAEVLRGYAGDKTAPSGWIKSTLRYLSGVIRIGLDTL
jgi:hypothetical protein